MDGAVEVGSRGGMHAGVELLGGWGGGWCSEDGGKLIGGWWLVLWWSSGVGVGVDGC